MQSCDVQDFLDIKTQSIVTGGVRTFSGKEESDVGRVALSGTNAGVVLRFVPLEYNRRRARSRQT